MDGLIFLIILQEVYFVNLKAHFVPFRWHQDREQWKGSYSWHRASDTIALRCAYANSDAIPGTTIAETPAYISANKPFNHHLKKEWDTVWKPSADK